MSDDTAHLVLLIDDDELVRATLTRALELAGFRVNTAENGPKGIENYKRERPDVIVTDILMPEKEGIETILEIRAESEPPPIIAISGGDRTGNPYFLDIAAKLGVRQTLAKPFRPNELVSAVTSVLETA